jgi:hypothetical protein
MKPTQTGVTSCHAQCQECGWSTTTTNGEPDSEVEFRASAHWDLTGHRTRIHYLGDRR